MISLIKTILAPLTISLKLIRSALIYKIRLNGLLASNFYDLIKSQGKLYCFEEEYTTDDLPNHLDAFGVFAGIPCRITIEERMLRAGGRGTDTIIFIKFLRYHKKKAIKLLETCGESISADLPVYIMGRWGSEKMGSLKKAKKVDEPYLLSEQYEDIVADIQKIANKELDKFGTILYGPPGNGKSYLIRYLAIKYQLPIHIVALDSEWNNENILRNISAVKGPAIILFEDFDNHYDKRVSLRPVKYSFDSILNALDGAFTVPENVAVFMTANNIDRLDVALKARPSRFKYVREIPNPGPAIIQRIFETDTVEPAILGGNYSLDILLHAKEILVGGGKINDAVEAAKQYSDYATKSRLLEAEAKKAEAEAAAAAEDKPGVETAL